MYLDVVVPASNSTIAQTFMSFCLQQKAQNIKNKTTGDLGFPSLSPDGELRILLSPLSHHSG